jgi:hypothetical protein
MARNLIEEGLKKNDPLYQQSDGTEYIVGDIEPDCPEGLPILISLATNENVFVFITAEGRIPELDEFVTIEACTFLPEKPTRKL